MLTVMRFARAPPFGRVHAVALAHHEQPDRLRRAMLLTRNLAFGMNILSLAGLALMGIGLTLGRQKQIGTLPAAGLMGIGTVLTFVGLYVAAP
jgi:hypothetical protein